MKLSRRRRKPAPETAEPASAAPAAPAAPVLQLRIFSNTDLPAQERCSAPYSRPPACTALRSRCTHSSQARAARPGRRHDPGGVERVSAGCWDGDEPQESRDGSRARMSRLLLRAGRRAVCPLRARGVRRRGGQLRVLAPRPPAPVLVPAARLLLITVPGDIEDYFREINAASGDDTRLALTGRKQQYC